MIIKTKIINSLFAKKKNKKTYYYYQFHNHLFLSASLAVILFFGSYSSIGIKKS